MHRLPIVGAYAAALLLAACTTLEPRRVSLPDPAQPIDCSPDVTGAVPRECADEIVESAERYRLHLIEVDDQGRPYAKRPEFGHAHAQVDEFLSSVREDLAAADNPQGLSVVMFVHGWKHGSASDDSNLEEFRKLLNGLARVESKVCNRRVVGVYLGWRGAALRGTADNRAVNLAESLTTFWSRKRSADRIANGVIHEVVGGLKALQHKARLERAAQASTGTGPAPTAGPQCDSRLKTTFVGHSFGGHILVSSMAQTLIEDTALDRELLSADGALQAMGPPDETVIVINPAVEGAQFDALSRIAQRVTYPHYRSPRFIAITSSGDRATRLAFRLGRRPSAMLKRFPDGDVRGRKAWVTAMGHDDQYLTHELVRWIDLPEHARPHVDLGECRDWLGAGDYVARADLEVQRAARFFTPRQGRFNANASDAPPRVYCGQRLAGEAAPGSEILLLRRFPNPADGRKVDLNTPVWNVLTHPPVLEGHGDFTNALLVEFVRQLYVESLYVK